MNRGLPDLSVERSPLSLVEMIYSTPIREVMTGDPIAVRRSETMRAAQELMREKSISGLPVAEDGRLYGIVSIHDLILTIQSDQLDQPVERHMTDHVVTLEEAMPLSMAIAYFGKYPFGRFPVLDARQRLAGILTVRDINVTLIDRLMRDVTRYESMLESEPLPGLAFTRVFHARRHDFEQGGKASTALKRHLSDHRVRRELIKRVAIAAYELEMNQVVHSIGGTLSFDVSPERVGILAQDRGPGIADMDLAMTEGYTTADDWIKSLGFGAGLGLPNVKRVADEFYLHSELGIGTTVKAVIRLDTGKENGA